MKKLLKRIMALSLCACMMMGAASTASAANISVSNPTAENGIELMSITPGYSHRVTINGSYGTHYLNMYATSSSNVQSGTDVTTWDTMASDGTQFWEFNLYNSRENTYTIKPQNHSDLVLNVYRDSSYNCNVYALSGNNPDDYVIKVTNTSGKYTLLLPNRGWYMTETTELPVYYNNVAHGYQVRWRTSRDGLDNAATQLWNIYT